MNKRMLGCLCAFGANFIFGLSFLFSKVTLHYTYPLIVLGLRFTVAFLFMTVLWVSGAVRMCFKGKKLLPVILMGVAQPLLYFVFEMYGIKLTSSALSGTIISLVPVAVMFASIFLKEKPSLGQFLWGIAALLGVVGISILSDDGNKNTLLGIFLLIGAVISSAMFNILSNRCAKEFSAVERTYIMFAIGCIGYSIIAFSVYGGEYISSAADALKNIPFIGALLYLSVLSSVGAFLMYNFATANISLVQASSFSNIITVVSVFAGIAVLKENFSLAQIICCGIILLGVFFVNMPKKSR